MQKSGPKVLFSAFFMLFCRILWPRLALTTEVPYLGPAPI
jgi:hypothetical protein